MTFCSSEESMRPGIYVASRASIPLRAAQWRALRSAGWPIVSTWIDEAGEGETGDLRELWSRIEKEVRQSAGVVLHVEADDYPLKGALIEVGMALGTGKRVGVYAPQTKLDERSLRPLGSWARHPLVSICSTLDAARDWVEEASPPFSQPVEQIAAWAHHDDPTRVIAASQKSQALHDGGASARSVEPYNIGLGVLNPLGVSLPPGCRVERVSDGDVRVYGANGESWLVQSGQDGFFGFVHAMFVAMCPAGKTHTNAPGTTEKQT